MEWINFDSSKEVEMIKRKRYQQFNSDLKHAEAFYNEEMKKNPNDPFICKDCEYRHDNGNCLKVGGFCTAVDDKHCEKIKQGGVTDDVCEWKQTSAAKYKTSCGYKLEEYFDTNACFCKQCGKKIKVVE